MQKESIKPDFKLLGKVIGDGFEIEDIHCEIYLSKELGEVGKVHFKPQKRTDFPDNWFLPFSFQGNQMMAGGEGIAKTIYIKKLVGNRRGQVDWGDIKEPYLTADIHDILIETPLKSSVTPNSSGHFHISPNSELSPYNWLTPSYTGEIIREKPTSFFSVQLNNKVTIKFNTLYNISQDDQTYATTMVPYLVAEFDNVPCDFTPSYKDIDDLLLVISFITRHSTVCTSWKLYTDSSIISNKRKRKPHKSIDSGADITGDKADKERVITQAYTRFRLSRHKQLLRSILGSISLQHKYISIEYFNLYSSLESLMIIFSKERNLEYITEDFNALKKSLDKVVNLNIPGDENKEKRNLLYGNLIGINRTPFKEIFTKFIEFYDLDINDLWSVVYGKESLSKIRNRVFHGSQLSYEEEYAVIYAAHDLRLIIERCLLAYFKIDRVELRTRSVLCTEAREKLKYSKKVFQNQG